MQIFCCIRHYFKGVYGLALIGYIELPCLNYHSLSELFAYSSNFDCLVSCLEGVVLLENPKGDNRVDLSKMKKVCSSIFGTNNTQLRFFDGGTGKNGFWPLSNTTLLQ